MINDLIYITTVDDPVPSNSRQLEIKSLWCQMFPNTGFRTGKLSSRVPTAWDCSQNFPKWGIFRDCSQKHLQTSGLFPKHWDCSGLFKDSSGSFRDCSLQVSSWDSSRILPGFFGIVPGLFNSAGWLKSSLISRSSTHGTG